MSKRRGSSARRSGYHGAPGTRSASGNGERGWKDGLYAIEYYRGGMFVERQCDALALLRDGAILASDRFGGVLEGRMVSSACGRLKCALLSLRLPPGVSLVTGHMAGPGEMLVDVSGLFDRDGDDLVGICEIGGELIELRFRYIGGLPSEAFGSRPD